MISPKHPYEQFLGDGDPFEVLADTQERIPALARALGTPGLQRTYALGKWTAAQVITHLADVEMAFGFRVRQIAAEPALGIQPFDEKLWARHYDFVDGLAAAQTFRAIRGWNLALFRRLTPEELERTSIHPTLGAQTTLIAIRVIAGHTLHHVAQLESILGG